MTSTLSEDNAPPTSIPLPASPTPGPCEPPKGWVVYVVQAGDHLSAIAKAHGTDWQTLAEVNDISNPSVIRVGQEICVPGEGAATEFTDSPDTSKPSQGADASTSTVSPPIAETQPPTPTSPSGSPDPTEAPPTDAPDLPDPEDPTPTAVPPTATTLPTALPPTPTAVPPTATPPVVPTNTPATPTDTPVEPTPTAVLPPSEIPTVMPTDTALPPPP